MSSEGTAEQLMAMNGLYKRLNDVQMDDEPHWREVREERGTLAMQLSR